VPGAQCGNIFLVSEYHVASIVLYSLPFATTRAVRGDGYELKGYLTNS